MMPAILKRHTSELSLRKQPVKQKRPDNWWDGRKQICEYQYRAPDGRLVFKKLRFELDPEQWNGRDKDFQIQRAAVYGSERCVKGGPEDQADWLYRLPDLLPRLDAGDAMHWMEGEKDAEWLWDLDIPATTNAMGAAKEATDAQARWLLNAPHVYIWIDKDWNKCKEVHASGKTTCRFCAIGAWNAGTRYNALQRVGYPVSTQVTFLKARHKGDKDAADHITRYGDLTLGGGPIVVSTKKLVELAKDHRPGNAWKSGYDE
jgi:hypothetical protein